MDIDKVYPKLSEKMLRLYYDRVLISKHELDDAASEQPQLYFDIAEREAEAVSVRDAGKKRLEDTEAKLSRSIRVKTQSDAKPPTEKAIADRLRREPEYQEVYEEYLALKERAAKWDALRGAAEQRSSMLKLLASLYTANYYTTESLRGSKDLSRVKDASYLSNRAALAKKRTSKGG